MKVLYILDYGTVGGATHAAVNMFRQMKSLGVTPVVATGGKRTAFNDFLDKEGIENVAAGHYTVLEKFKFRSIRSIKLLAFLLNQYYGGEIHAMRVLSSAINFKEIDLIHTNSARNSIGCRLSKKYGIPHIMHIREFGDKDFDCVSLRPGYIRLFNKYTDAFISISKSVGVYWESKGIDASKNNIVYDGVPFKDITVSSDEAKDEPDLRLFIAGGVIPAKGQHLAVEALGLLPENVRGHLTLDIAGWGNEQYIDSMKKHAHERGYEHQIHFLGALTDVHQRLGNYQVGLMCSRSEGFGLVTAEYMHAQLGVIASDSGACPEIIEKDKSGLLFVSGNAQDLACCIMKYFENRALLKKMSKEAKKRALTDFTDELNAKNIKKIYDKLVN